MSSRRRSARVVLGSAVVLVVAVVALASGRDQEPAAEGSRDGASSTPSAPSESPDASRSPAGASRSAPGFPDASTTGVPDGRELVPYEGPCTLTEPAVLSGVDATDACPAIVVQAPGVLIEESVVPRVESTAAIEEPSYSVEIVDSEVRAGAWVGGAVWGSNLTVVRAEVTGGQHSVHCNDHCLVEDSWLHEQHNPDGEASHNNAFISNGGTDMVLRGSTVHCTAVLNATGGGCTADLSLFGDFGPISHVTVDGNLFGANASSIPWCVYGGHAPGKEFEEATHVVFTDNVFQRGESGICGVYGPVTSFQTDAEGNVWSGNRWDDGEKLLP